MSCEFIIKPYESGNVEPTVDSDGNYYSLLSFTQAGGQGRVVIYVDGSSTNSSFYQTETNGSWFDVERKRNEITIRVQPNFTTEERDGYIEYAHNCDASKTCQICIHQCPTEYQIDVDAPIVAEETGTQINLVKVTTDGTDACGNTYSSGTWIDGDSGCVSDLVSEATNGGTDECGNTYSVGDWIYGVTGCKVGDSNAAILSFAEIVNTYEVMFDKWNEGDVKVIPVTTKGGSGRFYVKSVKQYQKKGICTATRTITEKTETQIKLTKAESDGTDKCGDSYSAGEWIDSSTGCVSDLVEEATHIGVDSCGNVYNTGDWLYSLTECKVGDSNATTLTFDEEEVTGSECTDYMDLQVEYDNGLKLILEQPEKCVEDDSGECPNCTGNGTLTIKSCGRTFVDEDNYYIITLAHLDYRFATCEIRVEYALPTRSVVLNPDDMEFDYLGRGDNTAEIMFQYTENGETKEFPDYGYEYEITTDCCDEDSETDGSDCVDCGWLTVTENPTSLSFSCELNPTGEDRSVEIKVCSVDEPNVCATMTVTQEGYRNYAVVLSDAAISFSFDDTTAKTISVYLYAGQTLPSKLEDILVEVDCDWLDVAIGAVTEEELYTEVEVSIAPKGEYTDTDKTQRDCNVTFKHPLDDNRTTTIQVIQFAEGQDSSIVQGIIGEYSDGQIIIPFIPASSEDFTYYLIASSTATWCSATIGGNDDLDVILKCTPNYWKLTRYCVVTVTDTINSTVYRYMVTQEYCDGNATDRECDPYEFSVKAIS